MSFFDAFSQFHFLRPVWLFGLIGLPVIWIALRKRALAGSDWASAIDPQLLKHLTPTDKQQSKHQFHAVILWVLALGLFSMAGPSWQEKPQPVIKVTDNMVVILDLSLSMLATDAAPNRLIRTKQKLQDLLKLRKEGNTALIVFSGDSHVVTPLTDDTKTIIANLPALDPFIMPVIGSRPELAVEQALQLLEQGKATQGRIILLGDGVEEHQLNKINEALEGRNTSLSILAAGTAAGGPINLPERGYLKDGDRVVIPKTDFNRLKALASANGGQMRPMSLDDQDLIALDIEGSKTQQRDDSEKSIDQRFDTWEDMGYLLLVLIIPLVLAAHRQGVIIVLALFFIPVDSSFAFDWDDLWRTKDQQAQDYLNQGQNELAAETFEAPANKAHALFKAKQYEQASEHYQQLDSDDDHYNRGNALAYQQKFKEALDAYDDALEKNSEHEDALYNKQRIMEFMEQQEQQKDQQSQSDSQNEQSDQSQQEQQQGDQNQDSSQQNGQQQDQQQSPSEQSDQSSDQNSEQQSDQQSDQQKQDSESEQDEQQKNAEESSQERQPSEQAQTQQGQAEAMPEPLSEEEKQSYEQWMRRVPDDPGGLLRRKFEQQARERNRQSREQGEPLW